MIETTKRWADRRRQVLGAEAVGDALRTNPTRGERWRHFGGTVFEIVETATHIRTLEAQVIYRDAIAGAHGRNWTCSLATFMGRHKAETWRFTRVPEEPIGADEEAEWDALFKALGGKLPCKTEHA